MCTANTVSILSNVSSVGFERSVLAVHQAFYIYNCIFTLPTQDTTFLSEITLLRLEYNAEHFVLNCYSPLCRGYISAI